MEHASVEYWDSIASRSLAATRDAILLGFRGQREFDDAGREDADHLVLPFLMESGTMLDLGCGIGRILKWSAPHCAEAIGVDISAVMLRRARSHLAGIGNIDLRRLPPTLELPVDSRSIDFAIYYHVSEHLEREDNLTLLREIRRCLRPKGRALVGMSLLDHVDNLRQFQKWSPADDPEGVRSRFYTVTEAELMLSMANLHPQLRLYIPGEFVTVVTPVGQRLLGAMPLVKLKGP